MAYSDFGSKFKDVWCENCGKQGHWNWECPYMVDTSNLVKIWCEICNEISHPTSDCPMKRRGWIQDDLKTNDEEIDEILTMIKSGGDPLMLKGNEQLKMIKDVMDTP